MDQVLDYARRAGVAVNVAEDDGDVVLTIDGREERYFGWDVEAMCARIDAAAEV